jgi:hypothetical protein
MPGYWHKEGLIFGPQGDRLWWVSHAAIPVVDRREGDLYRVYFSGRDAQGRVQIGYYEFDITVPHHILKISPEPVIGLGPLGAFDDNGVTSAWLVHHDGKQYQYYSGWTQGKTVPFYFYVGLAISSDNGETFHKVSAAPILERNAVDPYLTASPCVLIEDGVWRMWYVSCSRWVMEAGKPKHYYHIRYAQSDDGITWARNGCVCIDYASPNEYAIARPVVLKEDDLYKMWFTHRGAAYRLGYAESTDGLDWERKDDEVGIDVSDAGWDSQMIAYAHVFDHNGRRYMLYNGNSSGETGIGLAVWRG